MPVKKAIVGIKKQKQPVQKEVKEEAVKKQDLASELQDVQQDEVNLIHEIEIDETEEDIVDDELEEAVDEPETNEEKVAEEELVEEEPSTEEPAPESEEESGAKKTGKRMNLSVPYMQPNPIVSIVEAIRGAYDGKNQLRFREVVISLDNRLRDKDIATAIALKHFFLSNKVPCIIHADPEEVGYRSRIEGAEEEMTADLPKPYTYISVLVGVAKNEYLEDRAIDNTFLSFAFTGDEDASKNVAVVVYHEPKYCSTVPVIYPFIRDAVLHNGYKLTQRVATGFYEAIHYSLTYARKIHPKVLSTYHQLLEDGADYMKVEESFNSLPKRSLNFIKILLDKLGTSDGIATATVSYKELEQFSDIPEKKLHNIIRRSVNTFRYLEDVKAWCIYVEEKPGEYFVVLQTKNSFPYDMNNIAKRNNGVGTKNDAFCLIYDFDKAKIFKNLKDHIKDKDAKASAEE